MPEFEAKEKGSGRSANSSGASNLIFNYILSKIPKMSITSEDIQVALHSS